MNLNRIIVTVRALRIRRRWRQSDLAKRAAVSRDTVSSIERGRTDEFSLGDLRNVVEALDGALDVRLRWHGEDADRLLDEAHAATVAAVVERLKRWSWTTAIEVSFSIWGERGSIDVLAWHAATHTLLVVEVKSVVPDVQATLHGLDRKARLAGEIGANRGWKALAVGRLLAVAESPTSRGRVKRHAAIFDAALPLRGRALRSWLSAPTGPMSGLLFLSNAPRGSTHTSIWRRERARPVKRRLGGHQDPRAPEGDAMNKDPEERRATGRVAVDERREWTN